MPVPAVLIDWPNAEMAVLRLPGGPLTALTHDMLDELSAGLAEAAARPYPHPPFSHDIPSQRASATRHSPFSSATALSTHGCGAGSPTRDDGLALLAGRTAETARPDAAAYPCTWTALMGWLDSSVCWPFST